LLRFSKSKYRNPESDPDFVLQQTSKAKRSRHLYLTIIIIAITCLIIEIILLINMMTRGSAAFGKMAAGVSLLGTSFVLESIPKGITRIRVYRYNSWEGPWKTFETGGAKSYKVEGLNEGETYMFLANGD